MQNFTKIIILDRDGVINQDSDKYIKSAEEWQPIPGSLEAIAKLNQAGYKVVVCSNQSGLGRGLFSMTTLNEIHEKMHDMVESSGGKITAIFICPHKPEDNCLCRKPNPQMIFDICERFNINNLDQTMLVGDSLRDLLAISTAGGIPVLVKTGNGKKSLNNEQLPANTLIFDNLLQVSEYLISLQSEIDNDKH